MASDKGSGRDGTRVRYILLLGYLPFLLVHCSVLLQALKTLGHDDDPTARNRAMCLAAYKVVSICTMLFIVINNLRRRFSPSQLADWNLVCFGLLIPGANLMFQACLPSFDVTQRHWPSFFAFLMAMGICAAEFPLSHSLVQWWFAAPPLMFLDYSKVHRLHLSSTCEADGSMASCLPFFSPGFALRYLLSDGLVFIAVGLAAVIVSSIASGRYATLAATLLPDADDIVDRDCRGDGDVGNLGLDEAARGSCCSSRGDADPPGDCRFVSTMESFGICSARGSHGGGGKNIAKSDWTRSRPLESFGSLSGKVGQSLLRCLPQSALEDLMACICRSVDKSTAVGAVCVPTGGYYLLRALLARVDMKTYSVANITPEEWILTMLAFFMMGSQAGSNFDLELDQLQSRLQWSLSVLSDMLPDHIVRLIMSQHQGEEEEPHREEGDEAAENNESKASGSKPGNNPAQPPLQAAPPEACLLTLLEINSRDAMAVPLLTLPCVPPSVYFVDEEGTEVESRRSVIRCSSSSRSNLNNSSSIENIPLLLGGDPPGTVAAVGSVDQPNRGFFTRLKSGVQSLKSSISGAPKESPPLAVAQPPLAVAQPDVSSSRPSRSSQHGVLSRVASGLELSPTQSASSRTVSRRSSFIAGPAGPSPSGGRRRSSVATFTAAESHDCVTIFFSDLCGFSTWAHELSPELVMRTLNDLYSRLDDIILNEMPGLYKVETIGDAYMVAANLVQPDPHHAANMVRFALRARQEAAKVPRPDKSDGSMLSLRIGLHSGPTMSGIVGKIRCRFCLFGNTVNMASRTETSCPPGRIQLTATTHQLAVQHLEAGEVVFEDRGDVDVKGSAEPIRMFLAAESPPIFMAKSPPSW